MSTPPVDVVIAARDEAAMIGACLDALAAQDYPGAVQMCVVDNASGDATAAIAAARGARVVPAAAPGSGAARNAGLRATTAPLVAFLDGHVLVDRDWVRRMVDAFADPDVGACQSRIAHCAVSRRVQRYLDTSQALSNAHILADTVRGERNLYPWVTTAHCMYQRAAIDDAGGFDERLVSCEDVELAWRVVARGYRLAYVGETGATHREARSWLRFVTKGFVYGRGAAQLEERYRPHGGRTTFAPLRLRGRHGEAVLAGLGFRAGYHVQRLCLHAGLAHPIDAASLRPVAQRFRPWRSWQPGVRLRISPAVVYWLDDERACAVVVRPGTPPRRWVLEATEDLVWGGVARGDGRDAVIARMTGEYDVDAATAAADVDALIAELVAAGLLEQAREPGADGG